MLAGFLNAFKNALVSGFSGLSRPTNLQAGGFWVDVTNADAPNNYWSLKIYTGSADIEIFRINIVSAVAGFVGTSSQLDIKKVSSDAVGPILEFVKQRITGQVLDGDTVAEIRFIGRTNAASDVTVGYMRWNSSDDETTSASGGTLSFASTPDATAAISEQFRFINGVVESVLSLKINSLILVSQNVATTASIAALDTSKRAVEMTGSTITAIHGLDANGASDVVTIHNRSSAVVTLKHQSGTASAANRMKLPHASDLPLPADSSATLYYSATESLWKCKDLVFSKPTRTMDTIKGLVNNWTAPATTTEVNITVTQRCSNMCAHSQSGSGISHLGAHFSWGGVGVYSDDTGGTSSPTVAQNSSNILKFRPSYDTSYKNAFSPAWWGLTETGDLCIWASSGLANANGQFANGAAGTFAGPNPNSAKILGGLKFTSAWCYQNTISNFALTAKGQLYGWGVNDQGQLGLGDLIPRSSPVAVLGGLKFARFYYGAGKTAYGLLTDGTPYAWGQNVQGQLGVGDNTARSSPVAILGSLKLTKIASCSGFTGTSMVGLTTAGALYAWGANDQGQLGVGDIVARSSPVAVLGGLTFVDVWGPNNDLGGHFVAITSDGTAYAWGKNDNGQLGVNDLVSRSSPVAVVGGLKFKRIVCGRTLTLGLQFSDGQGYGWGDNSQGALGIGVVGTNKSSPTIMLGSIKMEDLSLHNNGSGIQYAMGQGVDGNTYAWGDNTSGNLGDGTNTAHSSPVAILGAAAANSRFGNNRLPPIQVTGGNVYAISLTHAECWFGNYFLGNDIDSITIEYEK